jgi:tetratricopeptide (TPR) repeat protein
MQELPAPRYIIADRRDLLGGRLIPILNALRLARVLGSKFLMTWYSDSSEFQQLVAGLTEIFEGDLVEPFDPVTGKGTLIGVDDPLLQRATANAEVVNAPEVALSGIGDALMRPVFSTDREIPYLLDRRFSKYTIDASEDVASISKGLAAEFDAMAMLPIVREAFARIDQKLAGDAFAALHVRRLHLLSDTGLQLNRFESYCSTSMCEALVDSLLDAAGGRAVLLASDSGALVRNLKRGRAGRVFSIDDVLNLGAFTGIQQALIDIYFLSRAPAIYGPKSAFGVVAAMIGGGTFHNILIQVAQRRIGGIDETGAVAFMQHQTSGQRSTTFKRPESGRNHSALICNLARWQLAERNVVDGVVETALLATAVRFSEYKHACFFGDCEQYLTTAREAAAWAEDAKITQELAAVADALTTGDAAPLLRAFSDAAGTAPGASGNKAASAAEFIALAVAMDCHAARGEHQDAIRCFLRAAERARLLGIGIRGLLMRIAPSYGALGQQALQMQLLESAVVVDPSYADAHFTLSEALNAAGLHAKAIEHARRAVALEPESGPFWFRLSQLLAAAGEQDEARKAAREAVLCEPQNDQFRAALTAMA